MKELKIYSSEYIMNTPMKPIEFVVDNLISQGLFILAGPPLMQIKIFQSKLKSWRQSRQDAHSGQQS